MIQYLPTDTKTKVWVIIFFILIVLVFILVTKLGKKVNNIHKPPVDPNNSASDLIQDVPQGTKYLYLVSNYTDVKKQDPEDKEKEVESHDDPITDNINNDQDKQVELTNLETDLKEA